MRYPTAIAMLALVPASAGQAGAPAKQPPQTPQTSSPGLTISHVSPATALIDEKSEVTIQLQGSGIGQEAGVEVTYDTDPATQIRVCKKGSPTCSIEVISDSAVNCTIKWAKGQKPDDALLPVGHALHFAAVGAKSATSKPSDETFMAQEAVKAGPISIILADANAPLQIHVDAPGAGSGARVMVFDGDRKQSPVVCSTPQVIGGEDLICFVEQSEVNSFGSKLRVQVLRANESGAPSDDKVAWFHKEQQAWLRGSDGSDAPRRQRNSPNAGESARRSPLARE